MSPENLLNILNLAERLKNTTRHCYTSEGRHESVAEHRWRAALRKVIREDTLRKLEKVNEI